MTPLNEFSVREATRNASALPVVPASAFGIVLGLSGLANAWKAADHIFEHSKVAYQSVGAVACAIWLALAVLYCAKWIAFRKEALDELHHPIQCCFVGLIGVSAMLVASILANWSLTAATALFWIGLLWTIVFAVWRTGALWRGDRDPSTTTPVLYLPTVAGSFVIAIAGTALGYGDLGLLAFGAGLFSWLAIESVLLNRLLNAPPLNEPLRPTIGIQLAPPAVGLAAYLASTTGPLDIMAYALLGYAILQCLLMIRILPWVAKQPFTAAYWAFSFGATAFASDLIHMSERGGSALVQTATIPAFIAINLLILALVAMTAKKLFEGKLFPIQYITRQYDVNDAGDA
jgi:tellurite resistance protein